MGWLEMALSARIECFEHLLSKHTLKEPFQVDAMVYPWKYSAVCGDKCHAVWALSDSSHPENKPFWHM